MARLEDEIDEIAAETDFSGVVRVDHGGNGVELAKAYGLAARAATGIANEVSTPGSGTASAHEDPDRHSPSLSLIERGPPRPLARRLARSSGATYRSIGDDVTIEHLLAHRSGIGDYLDEEVEMDLSEYLLPVPVHELATTEQYLAPFSAGSSRSSRPASASPTATAATSCSR